MRFVHFSAPKDMLNKGNQMPSGHPQSQQTYPYPPARRPFIQIQVLPAHDTGKNPLSSSQPKEKPARKREIKRHKICKPHNREIKRHPRIAYGVPGFISEKSIKPIAIRQFGNHRKKVMKPVQYSDCCHYCKPYPHRL